MPLLRLLTFLPLFAMLAACAGSSAAPAWNHITDDEYIKHFSNIEWQEIGRSVENRPIHKAEFGAGDDVTLFLSCFHGGERCTPRFGYEFAQLLHDNPALLQPGKRVVVVPVVNPDGFAKGTRANARDVDLNRNYPTRNWGQQPHDRRVKFGTAPASEPETQVIIKLLEETNPDKILSIHQPLKCNNNDGPNGLVLAELMAKHNGYPVEPYIGYPTPGSFGTYAGMERGIPMVTLELPKGTPNTSAYDQMWEENREALLAVVNYDAQNLVKQGK